MSVSVGRFIITLRLLLPDQRTHLGAQTFHQELSLGWAKAVILISWGFIFILKSKPRGSRHTKLNFMHLIWPVNYHDDHRAQITQIYWSGLNRLWATCHPHPPLSTHPLPDTLHWALSEISRHSCHPASHNIRGSFLFPLCKHATLYLVFLLQHYDLSSCTKEEKDWYPSSLAKACIATLLVILVIRQKNKK